MKFGNENNQSISDVAFPTPDRCAETPGSGGAWGPRLPFRGVSVPEGIKKSSYLQDYLWGQNGQSWDLCPPLADGAEPVAAWALPG